MPRYSLTCAVCQNPMQKVKTSKPQGEATCNACRRASREHGSEPMYSKSKCRCEICSAAQTVRMREYYERRKAAGNPIDWNQYRELAPALCPTCGKSFMARVKSGQRFCSRSCTPSMVLKDGPRARAKRMTPEGRAFRARAEKVARMAAAGSTGKNMIWVQGLCWWCGEPFVSPGLASRYCSPEHRAEYRRKSQWIDWRVRLAIYERDGWTCQLCGDESRLGMRGTAAPSLDHIVPRSKGGSDDPSNLRLLCRWCNSKRGDLTWFSDEDVRRAVTS